MKIKKLIKALKRASKNNIKDVIVSGFVGLNNSHVVFDIDKMNGKTINYVDGHNRLHLHVSNKCVKTT